MSEIPTPQESGVTPEFITQERLIVGSMREQKGRQEEALARARLRREQARNLGLHEHVVNFYWEECLIGKHYVMLARDEIKNPIQKGLVALRGLRRRSFC
mgnify:CR=1 FL=1